jgi:hypothetical protein
MHIQFFFCVLSSRNAQEFDFDLEMVYFATMEMKDKFHDSCIDILFLYVKLWQVGKGIYTWRL